MFNTVFVRHRMQRLFRIFLAALYVTGTLTVVVSHTDAARDELARATSAKSQLDSQDGDSAGQPHFSHAQKTGSEFAFSPVSLVWFIATSVRFPPRVFGFGYDSYPNPRAARAPPISS